MSLVVTGTAHATGSTDPNPGAYQDYLHAPSGASIGASGSDQCGVDISMRVGNWVCFAPTKTEISRRASTNDTTNWCNEWDCRYRYDDFAADLDAAGIYGFGGEWLGRVDVYAFFQLAGAQTWSQDVYYRNSRDSKEVVFVGDLLNAAPGVVGGRVDGAFSLYNAGNVPGGTTKRWDPNGYKSYDNQNWDHTQVHEWAFGIDGYPGYWYLYAKSTCTQTDDKTIYRFYNVEQVPADANGAGWNR